MRLGGVFSVFPRPEDNIGFKLRWKAMMKKRFGKRFAAMLIVVAALACAGCSGKRR